MARKRRSSDKAAGSPSPNQYQVFVSHATADKWLAKTICEKIEGTGAKSFRDDRDIRGGDNIPDEIRRQIRQSKEIVVILTPESVNRPWVLLEIGAAWATRLKMRMIAVIYHIEFDTIPDILRNKKAISLNDFDQYLSELTTRVREHNDGL